MRIVILADFFHPDAGYIVNILPKYFSKYGNEVTIITGTMDKTPEGLTKFFGKDNIPEKDKQYANENNVSIIRLPLRAFVSGRAIFTRELDETIDKLNPDLLFLYDVDTFEGIRFIFKSKKLKFPIVFSSSMLEMASENPFAKYFRYFYNFFVTPLVKKMEFKTIRVQDDPYLEKCLGIPLRQCPYISFGTDTLLFNRNLEVRKRERKQLSINSDDFVLVYTGKLDEAKGGLFLANAFIEKFENANNKNVVLVVVGNTSGEYGENVEKIFSKSATRIIRIPTQSYRNLAKFYQMADLSIFPKQCSLSFFDAQACGLPVLLEDNNINIERTKYGNGFTFKSGDKEDFREKITSIINMPIEKLEDISKKSIEIINNYYSYEKISKEYLEIFEKEKKRFDERGRK